VVYKGNGWLDLRAAELSGPVTTFLAVAYKSTVTVLVPPGVRVEMTGFGVTQGADEDDPGYRLANDAPVIHVPGVADKGAAEITPRPPERPALRGYPIGPATGPAQPLDQPGRWISTATGRPGGTGGRAAAHRTSRPSAGRGRSGRSPAGAPCPGRVRLLPG